MVLRENPALATNSRPGWLSRAGQAMRWLVSLAAPALRPTPGMAFAAADPGDACRDGRQPLRQVMQQVLIPTLAARQRPQPTSPQADVECGDTLARLLLQGRLQDVDTLLRQAQQQAGSLAAVVSGSVEPAARQLGDLWRDDACLCVEVTLALCHLQAAVRRLDPEPPLPARACRVLLVPAPGEAHVLTAALHGDIAWQRGWTPQVEFPASDEALQALLARQWYALLDITLSPSFAREHGLSALAASILRARRASLNPELLVVASGRVFHEDPVAGHRVGADESSRSALDFSALLDRVAATRR